jgi:hypothetical protein
MCAATFVLAFDNAVAEERKYATPVGAVIVDIDSGWRQVEAEIEGMSGIAFEVGSGGRTMNFMLMANDDASTDAIDPAAVRKLAEDWRKEEMANKVTVSEIRDLTGKHVSGYYFQGKGAPGAKPTAGEFTSMIAGVILTGTMPLIFTVAWNEGGEAPADRAFAAVKGLRFASR